MSFGVTLKNLLAEKEISQKEFAAMLNIAPSTLNGYIKDNRQPDIDLIKDIAGALNVSTDYLLEFKGVAALSPKELLLVSKLRELDSCQREIIYDLVNITLKKSKENGQ